MDPLLIAHPPPSYAQATPVFDDDMAFDAYCIVCDKFIVQPKAVDPPIAEPAKPVMKKKFSGGTIRVKNPDGSTTTRSANGQKVTRPGLKRNPNSAARLVAVNNVAAKLQPLTRSKTTDATSSPSVDAPKNADELSPHLHNVVTPGEVPFCSSIYCSRQCMDVDAGRSSEAYKDIARTLSYEFSNGYPLEHINTTGLPITDHGKSPYGPPSPLFISGSDTESSSASNVGGNEAEGPACSAPKTMEYFRIHKEGPDSAWNEMQRQRRSSMQPATHRPMYLNSTDSLTSLWNHDAEPAFARSVSGSGKMRPMTPMNGSGELQHPGAGKRTFSAGSDQSASPIPARTLARSNLSHTSLAASPSSLQAIPIPPEFGSAPSHTLNLLQSYASAFPVRSPSGTSNSFSQRGFVFPGSTSESDSRRSSISRQQGTIRAKSKSDATWDNFGKEAVEQQQQRSQRRVSNAPTIPTSVPTFRGRPQQMMPDTTPKQSLEREGGCWKIKYYQPGCENDGRQNSRSVSRSSKASSSSGGSETYHTKHGLAIPQPTTQLSTSSSTARSRTPQTGGHMPPPSAIPQRSPSTNPIPDLTNLRLETGYCGVEHTASPQSVPRNGFNWAESERKGMKTYEIPEVSKFKLDRNKAGLFYFQ